MRSLDGRIRRLEAQVASPRSEDVWRAVLRRLPDETLREMHFARLHREPWPPEVRAAVEKAAAEVQAGGA